MVRLLFARNYELFYSLLQQIGRRAISLPTTIYAEAPNIEVLYELDKVKKVHPILLCARL